MSTEKRAGDKGMTTLSGSGMISKADERIALIGTIDELNCYIGGIKAESECEHLRSVLERIQRGLLALSEGIRQRWGKEPAPGESEVAFLEQETERILTELGDAAEPALPGANRETAAFEMAAAITRRAEHDLIIVDRRYSVRAEARQFLNRLSDYFQAAARYKTVHAEETAKHSVKEELVERSGTAGTLGQSVEQIVRKVIGEMGAVREMTLQQAKVLIEQTEKEAIRRGMNCVICICNAHGNPVAVHVMDGAFLVSFDAAIKKAYSSVAVKMPTLELAKIAGPGQTFYGVELLDGGKITVIGGGVPLKREGVLLGAIGVSGGTGEEDDSLAKYTAALFEK